MTTVKGLTAYVYNDQDQVIETIVYGVEPAGFVPDANNVPSSAIVTQSVYNSLGQQTATIDGLGRQTDYQYDSAGRLVSVTQPSLSGGDTRRPRTEYHYDSQGHRTYVVTNIYEYSGSSSVVYVTKSNNGNESTTGGDANSVCVPPTASVRR